MNLVDILIILGCLAGGYWIVNSVMGPGVDITRRDRTPPGTSKEGTPENAPQLPLPRQSDWQLLLDVPLTASRPDIEAAFKRQLNKALAAQDTHRQDQLRLARDAALAQLSRRNLR